MFQKLQHHLITTIPQLNITQQRLAQPSFWQHWRTWSENHYISKFSAYCPFRLRNGYLANTLWTQVDKYKRHFAKLAFKCWILKHWMRHKFLDRTSLDWSPLNSAKLQLEEPARFAWKFSFSLLWMLSVHRNHWRNFMQMSNAWTKKLVSKLRCRMLKATGVFVVPTKCRHMSLQSLWKRLTVQQCGPIKSKKGYARCHKVSKEQVPFWCCSSVLNTCCNVAI